MLENETVMPPKTITVHYFSDIVECSIDKTWFRVARILLHVRLTQRPLKFHGKLNVVR